MTANLRIYGDKDYFGKPYYVEGLGNVTKMGGDTYITIPDSHFPASPTTAIGAAANPDLVSFQETPAQAAMLGVSQGANYATGGSVGPSSSVETYAAGNATSRGLFSCYILYPDAYEFGETEQYTDLSLNINIDPQRSNEEYIYALVSRESMRMWDQGVVRVFFGQPGQAVRTNA